MAFPTDLEPRMKRLSDLVVTGLACIAATLIAVPQQTASAQKTDPLPLENWAIREVMQGTAINPSGDLLAYMSNPSREGDPIIEIYETEKLDGKPSRVGAKHMEVTGFSWVSDNHMLVSFRQKVRNRIEDFNQGVYEGKLALFNVEEEEFTELGDNLSIEQILYQKPGSVIISQPNDRFGLNVEEDPFAAFRPRTYYELDLDTGRKSLILKGNERTATAVFDAQGNPRFSQGYDRASREFVFYARSPGEDSWREIRRFDSFKLEAQNFALAAFDPNAENVAYVLANNGHDKLGLWAFDLSNGEFLELIHRDDEVDVAGVRMHSHFWKEGPRPVAALVYGPKFEAVWFDAQEEALYAGLEQAIPNAHQISISSRSVDGKTMTVFNSGPKDPGSYYLFRDGELSFLGSQNPLVSPEDLSEVRYIRYPTRDGREAAGYVTVPDGEPPFPLVVMPHGGPFVSEVVGYDEWGQVLANNGYMVLQPQYRGSLGYGLEHWEIAYGEGGLKMQDDKDDGALWLVEQGLADEDRLAMYGWSYGGYAAAVAASREPNIYQCAIAGAAVVDGNMQLNYYRDSLLPAIEYWELRRREGVQPLDEASEVNIPLMVIHGDVDQRVPFEHYEKYTDALDRAGIPYEGVVLEGADHFYNTLFFNHQKELYSSILGFLEEDCGPGGL
jgi:dipeptidyl aminopeptidase/acylaminoacyl peptidase